jgi:DNA-binding IclR family transcriptional regulator
MKPASPPEDRAAAFRRSEQERLEAAVLKFVAANPGTDAEIVAVRVGMPKGQAQGLLDDLVIRGRLRMKSGQHGRCYVVAVVVAAGD